MQHSIMLPPESSSFKTTRLKSPRRIGRVINPQPLSCSNSVHPVKLTLGNVTARKERRLNALGQRHSTKVIISKTPEHEPARQQPFCLIRMRNKPVSIPGSDALKDPRCQLDIVRKPVRFLPLKARLNSYPPHQRHLFNSIQLIPFPLLLLCVLSPRTVLLFRNTNVHASISVPPLIPRFPRRQMLRS